MKEQILQMIADQFQLNVEDLSPEMSFKDDLDSDSIELVELVMTIEEEYGIEVDDKALESIQTIGDVIDYMEHVCD